MAPVQCLTLLPTTNPRTTSPPLQEPASWAQEPTISPTGDLVIDHSSLRTLPSWEFTRDLTPTLAVMKVTVSCRTVPPGLLKRTCTQTSTALPTVTALTSPSPSTSQSWRSQMAAWSASSRSLMSLTSEQTRSKLGWNKRVQACENMGKDCFEKLWNGSHRGFLLVSLRSDS